MSDIDRPATWRVVLAAIFDFFTAFIILGFIVGWLTGGLTGNGFALNGLPAFILFAGIIAYFFVFNRFLGGTLWKYIFRTARPR